MAQTASDRIQDGHLQRRALVYVRQSTFVQVAQNQESARRQYNLRQRALALGWATEQVEVIDEDQGRTGATSYGRSGFAQLMSEVALGAVGIVLALESSRLARNNADWQRLVWFCGLTETLLGDHERVYDPSLLDDRMVLGLRGTISEMEWHTIRKRMSQAARSKAERGALEITLPAGLQWEAGQIRLCDDRSVVDALKMVFETFDRVGSARQVALHLGDAGVKLPRRAMPHSSAIRWVEPSAQCVYHILRQPQYAGAYVFGKKKTVRQIDSDGHVRTREVAVERDAWPVCIVEHHEGLIDWNRFERIQKQLSDNVSNFRTHHQGAPRQGAALLQGLAYCGKCGQRMTVAYSGTGQRFAQFHCRRRWDQRGTDDYCQVLGGRRIETAVVELFLQAIQPAAVEVALQATATLEREQAQLVEHWRQRIERANYDALQAQERYELVDARNRLVAAQLERRYNDALAHVQQLEQQAAAHLRQPSERLSDTEKMRIGQLACDVDTIWQAPTTTHRDRKRLLRAALDRVVINSQERVVDVHVYWKGGQVDALQLPRVRRGDPVATTDKKVIALIKTLVADGLDDTQIARVASRQGLHTAMGLSFTKRRVQSIRSQYGIPCATAVGDTDGAAVFTAEQAARELGVSSQTVHQWLSTGLLAGRQAAPGAPWRIVLDDQTRARLAGQNAPPGWVGLEQAARRLGVTKQTVSTWVKQRKLQAIRVTKGRRQGWRICVDSTGLAKQQPLLEAALDRPCSPYQRRS